MSEKRTESEIEAMVQSLTAEGHSSACAYGQASFNLHCRCTEPEEGPKVQPGSVPCDRSHQKFEGWSYKVVPLVRSFDSEDLEDRLNGLGIEEWEVCGISEHRLVLKRPKSQG